jgi:hypothetical protein
MHREPLSSSEHVTSWRGRGRGDEEVVEKPRAPRGSRKRIGGPARIAQKNLPIWIV